MEVNVKDIVGTYGYVAVRNIALEDKPCLMVDDRTFTYSEKRVWELDPLSIWHAYPIVSILYVRLEVLEQHDRQDAIAEPGYTIADSEALAAKCGG